MIQNQHKNLMLRLWTFSYSICILLCKFLGVDFSTIYILTSITSPLFIEPLDIVTKNFETKFCSVKLPCYYPYHPSQCH